MTDGLIAQLKFSEFTLEAGIDHHYLGINEMGAGAAFFDMDNDGDEDLWLSGGLKRDALYENDGTGHFTEIGEAAGLRATLNKVTTGVITGDLDNDGYKDVLVITHIGFPNFILKNNGNKTFEELFKTGLEKDKAYCLAAAMSDINQDGFLDIYAGNYIQDDALSYSQENPDSIIGFNHKCHANNFYLNNGDWTFTEVTNQWQVGDRGCALAITFSDYDGDFDPDLLVVNDFGQWVLPNALLQNNLSAFDNVSSSSNMDVGIYGMGIAAGDYDNDLDLDYYMTNLGENVLLKNNGDGTFSNYTIAAGVEDSHVTDQLLATGWGTAFIDFDNDSDLDLYVVNGYVPAASFITNAKANPNRCFENIGNGSFIKVLGETEVASPNWGRGLACADIDNDGDIDFLVGNVNKQATSDTIQKVQLFKNESQHQNNWLKIKLEGTINNRDGFGSQVRIKVKDRWLMQEANGGFGTHASQNSSILHFGLATVSLVDSLIIFWQGGQQQILTNVATNQLLHIIEETDVSTSSPQFQNTNIELNCYPNPFRHQTTIAYELNQKSSVSIALYDHLGRVVFSQYFPDQSKGKYNLQWTARQKGIYFLQLKTREQIIYKNILSN